MKLLRKMLIRIAKTKRRTSIKMEEMARKNRQIVVEEVIEIIMRIILCSMRIVNSILTETMIKISNTKRVWKKP